MNKPHWYMFELPFTIFYELYVCVYKNVDYSS